MFDRAYIITLYVKDQSTAITTFEVVALEVHRNRENEIEIDGTAMVFPVGTFVDYRLK